MQKENEEEKTIEKKLTNESTMDLATSFDEKSDTFKFAVMFIASATTLLIGIYKYIEFNPLNEQIYLLIFSISIALVIIILIELLFLLMKSFEQVTTDKKTKTYLKNIARNIHLVSLLSFISLFFGIITFFIILNFTSNGQINIYGQIIIFAGFLLPTAFIAIKIKAHNEGVKSWKLLAASYVCIQIGAYITFYSTASSIFSAIIIFVKLNLAFLIFLIMIFAYLKYESNSNLSFIDFIVDKLKNLKMDKFEIYPLYIYAVFISILLLISILSSITPYSYLDGNIELEINEIDTENNVIYASFYVTGPDSAIDFYLSKLETNNNLTKLDFVKIDPNINREAFYSQYMIVTPSNHGTYELTIDTTSLANGHYQIRAERFYSGHTMSIKTFSLM
jgi:hypothetical protein